MGWIICSFNSAVGATTGCLLNSLLGTIPVQEMDANFGIREDVWFGSVRAANKVEEKGERKASFKQRLIMHLTPRSSLKRHWKNSMVVPVLPWKELLKMKFN
jgi:hypothetical protein